MKLYLAPLEGISGYVYRQAYHACYEDADKYFTPFLAPHTKRSFNARERNDLIPEHNAGMYTVPQVLSKSGEDVAAIAEELKAFGYQEININAGCPSGTVVSKGRGAGLLDDERALLHFLDEMFEKTDAEISIKTRLGMEYPDEFEGILKIYNRFPIKELILHPRVREDYYKNKPDWTMVEYALEYSSNPLVYNGDIFTVEDYERFTERFPTIDAIMLGRGVIRDPALIEKIRSGGVIDRAVELKRLYAFHNKLVAGYQEEMSGEKNVLFKMKELWFYLGTQFTGIEKPLKKIKKANSLIEYQAAVSAIFSTGAGK